MSNLKLVSFRVSRYRSLLDVKIPIDNQKPVVICGENNIGKTNFLRAMNVFFNHIHDRNIFSPAEDIPHHVYYGSRGAGCKTELTGEFHDGGKVSSLAIIFNHNDEVEYKKNKKTCDRKDAVEILQQFKFLFVESNNVDLPVLMSEILEEDGLLPLDLKRRKQSEPLAKLNEFIDLSQKAIADIEREINKCFNALTDFDGILKDKKVKINFAEFDRLRDVVKTMTSITLSDGNDHEIASKGSGAQRAVFISLMQYISRNSKKKIIWGIDEPEVFLQPRLQKKLHSVIKEIVKDKKQPAILTTHSQHFIELDQLSNTHIFKGEIKKKEYSRKPDKIFYETNTFTIKVSSAFEKSVLIKEHLGISNNDGWDVLPYNIIVEGEEDKKYLEALFENQNILSPNIIWSGGASKIGGYLQYYNIFAKDLEYKPEFICVFDNDEEGRNQSKRVKPKSYSNILVGSYELPRGDGKFPNDAKGVDWEIEDFLPAEVVFQAVNGILKSENYKQITKSQIKNRTKPANQNTQILKYCEDSCKAGNSDKEPFSLDNEGRKKQLCEKISGLISKSSKYDLNDFQSNFLKSLAKQSETLV